MCRNKVKRLLNRYLCDSNTSQDALYPAGFNFQNENFPRSGWNRCSPYVAVVSAKMQVSRTFPPSSSRTTTAQHTPAPPTHCSHNRSQSPQTSYSPSFSYGTAYRPNILIRHLRASSSIPAPCAPNLTRDHHPQTPHCAALSTPRNGLDAGRDQNGSNAIVR